MSCYAEFDALLYVSPSNHTFKFLSVTREGESLCETKEQ